MGASGGFPIDLILFGMIAAFLVLRLKSILGRRTGYERPAQPTARVEQPRDTAQAPAPPPPVQRALPDPATPLGQTLARMNSVDRTFDPNTFLQGAEQAFAMIVGAFAAGDRATLRPLLGDEIRGAFEAAIAEREKEVLTQVTDIRSIHAMSIEDAHLTGTVASIVVRIVSDQVNMTHAANGQVLSGTDAVTEINDIWTFERDLARPDPAWHLVAARSA